jgi:hypothetical protein
MNKIIFIFGNGNLPRLILKKIKNANLDFKILSISEKNSFKSFDSKSVKLGRIITELNGLKKKGYSKILMAGSINRPRLSDINPDFNSLKLLPKFAKTLFEGGDNKLLKFVITELENLNFKILYIHKTFPDLFLGPGNQTKIKISKNSFKDINKGSLILKNNSKFDIGQSILIQEGNVIGIEAVQGTDNLIKQSLPYLQKVKKGVLIKLIKVKQDLRADLPTIGLKTLINCYKSGVVGIAYSANMTIFLEKEKILSFCKQKKIFLYGL